jgi:two-component system sensor histidine kinase DegS
MRRARSSMDGTAAFRRRYRAALRARLRPADGAAPDRAHRLGLAACELGIGTLRLARMHEATLASLTARSLGRLGRRDLAMRAASFFTEVILPIETMNSSAAGSQRVAQKALRASRGLHRVLLGRSRAMEEELRQLSHSLLRSHEQERMRISRELHDVLGQKLAGIQIGLSGLEIGSTEGMPGFRGRISRTRRLVMESMQTVHRFARDLRPILLDDLGLVPALHGFAKAFGRQSGLKVRVSASRNPAPLDTDRRTVLFRVAQEALTNADRHARARNARITLRKRPDAIRLEVWNDGRTFDVERVRHIRRNRRLGILCMMERVEMVGGRLSIESHPGRGTTVRAEVPLSGR